MVSKLISQGRAISSYDLVFSRGAERCESVAVPQDWNRIKSRWLGVALLFVIWALCNPYFEIDRSSLIYSGRALADLDPNGVGRDIMFRLDGQSGFTLFGAGFRAVVEAIGPSATAKAVSIASIVVSFIGVVALAGTICAGRARVLAVIFAAALPASYGGFKIFSFSETAATPRPFAEALVLCGLAALVRKRYGLAVTLLLGAATLHPIMALPGLVVLIFWLISLDRRWLVPLALILVVVLVGALFKVGALERLTMLIDPDWKAVLVTRNPHLFPTLWPGGWIGRFAARAATVIICASLASGLVRKLLIIVLAVGLAGFGVAYAFDERLPVVLLVQAQTWRAMWLVFALATMAAARCTVELWPRGGAARVVVAALALSWAYADTDQIAILFAVCALGFHFALNPAHYILHRRTTAIIVGVAALLLIARLGQTELRIAGSVGDVPSKMSGEAMRVLSSDWDYTPLAFIASCCVVAWRGPLRASLRAGLIACGVASLAMTWDRRSAETRFFDAGAMTPDLERLVASRKGEIFWIGGVRETWIWLARPQWLSPIQGAGIVFSRPLALHYRDRSRRAVAAGLDDGAILEPYGDFGAVVTPSLDPKRIDTFCKAADAPAWIVAPLAPNQDMQARLLSAVWTAPIDKLAPLVGGDGRLAWRNVSRYGVIACARS